MSIPAGFEHIVREQRAARPAHLVPAGRGGAVLRRADDGRRAGGAGPPLPRGRACRYACSAADRTCSSAMKACRGLVVSLGAGDLWRDRRQRPPDHRRRRGELGPRHFDRGSRRAGGAGTARRHSGHDRRRSAHQRRHAHGGDIGQWTVSATVLNRRGENRHPRPDRAALRLSRQQPRRAGDSRSDARAGAGRSAALTKQMQQAWILKRAAQPISDDQNTGQIFKSPGGVSAAV